MSIVWALCIAFIAAIVLTVKPKQPPERHHIYYCMHPHVVAAFPCMYRKNEGIDV